MDLAEPAASAASSQSEAASELAIALRHWLVAHAADLEPYRRPLAGSMEAVFAHEQILRQLLWDSGWTRWGWPETCGGLGGHPILRGVVLDELAAAGYTLPETFGLAEIVGPTLARFAPGLHGEVAKMLRGDELWCQGFSEPEAGSDLASLRTRARPQAGGWVLNGQKVWTSRAHIAQRCLVLARTGTAESRHRGLSMFLVDLATPGISVRPIGCVDGRNHLSEVFFTDVLAPAGSLVGEIDGGWQVAMYLLQFERGNFAWQRQAWLTSRLTEALAEATEGGEHCAHGVGEAYLDLLALRSTSYQTLCRLAEGQSLGPVISIDKVLLSTAEKSVLDAARALVWPSVEIGDGPSASVWRQEWWFSRVTSILGGSVEVQRDIIANRVLALPRG